MISLLENSVYIGVFLSIATFWLGMYLQQKFRSPVLNPLLVSTVLMIGFIKFTGYDYATMDRSLQYINYLLTPATICLAVPLYEQMKTLKNNMSAIFLGIFSAETAKFPPTNAPTIFLGKRIFQITISSVVLTFPINVCKIV